MTSSDTSSRRALLTSRRPRRRCGCRCTAFLALLVLYFVGMDQGATSVFGDDMTSTSSCTTPGTARLPLPLSARKAKMEKQIIGRGLLAGAVAGVLAFVFARIFVEPVIGRAIEFEDGVGAAHEAMRAAAATAATKTTRIVHPRCSGQHRHGIRGAGVQRRDGRVVRGRVLRGLRPGRRRLGARTLSVLLAGGMLLALYARSGAEVPAEPAGDRASTRRSASARCCTC